jgi:hypothetical protein
VFVSRSHLQDLVERLMTPPPLPLPLVFLHGELLGVSNVSLFEKKTRQVPQILFTLLRLRVANKILKIGGARWSSFDFTIKKRQFVTSTKKKYVIIRLTRDGTQITGFLKFKAKD